MAAESSASAANRRGVEGKPKLIMCPKCHRRKVVECRSKQPWSKDQIFYTCPDHNKEGTGCPFFLSEADYIKYLETETAKEKGAGVQSDQVSECLLDKNVELGNGDATTVQVELRTLIGIGYDVAGLPKCIICLCLVIVVVQLLLVFVGMKK